MSDLTNLEKRQSERLFQMGDGYIFDFSNRTFQEFVTDSTGRDSYDERYNYASGSKSNRLRGFCKEENNRTVGRLMGDLLEYGFRRRSIKANDPDLEPCRRTISRLLQDAPVPELDALTALSDERDFEIVAKAVDETIGPRAAAGRCPNVPLPCASKSAFANGVCVNSRQSSVERPNTALEPAAPMTM